MRVLLDTHVAIWSLVAPARLGAKGRMLLEKEAEEVFVSAASIWEIAIKHMLRKRNNAPPFSGQEAAGFFADMGYRSLSISMAHAAYVEQVPPLHADPFDRLLLAQAICEPLRLVTADKKLAGVSDAIILIG